MDMSPERDELRAEADVMGREHPAGHRHHATWVPIMRNGRLVLPSRHYQLASWVRNRAEIQALPHEHVRNARRRTLWLTIFAGVRMTVWVVAMALVGLWTLGAGGPFLHWFVHLSSLVVWVAVISYYCNASTDAANMMAGIAALYSADTHEVVSNGTLASAANMIELESDIAQLAELQPGEEAQELAATIRRKIAAESSSPGTGKPGT